MLPQDSQMAVSIQGFEVLALIFIFDSFDDDEELQEEERTGRLSIRLLDLAEGLLW